MNDSGQTQAIQVAYQNSTLKQRPGMDTYDMCPYLAVYW